MDSDHQNRFHEAGIGLGDLIEILQQSLDEVQDQDWVFHLAGGQPVKDDFHETRPLSPLNPGVKKI